MGSSHDGWRDGQRVRGDAEVGVVAALRPHPPHARNFLVDGAFDNSAQNPFNPDPSISVYGGEQSWEEMFFGFMTWKDADQSQWAVSE